MDCSSQLVPSTPLLSSKAQRRNWSPSVAVVPNVSEFSDTASQMTTRCADMSPMVSRWNMFQGDIYVVQLIGIYFTYFLFLSKFFFVFYSIIFVYFMLCLFLYIGASSSPDLSIVFARIQLNSFLLIFLKLPNIWTCTFPLAVPRTPATNCEAMPNRGLPVTPLTPVTPLNHRTPFAVVPEISKGVCCCIILDLRDSLMHQFMHHHDLSA